MFKKSKIIAVTTILFVTGFASAQASENREVGQTQEIIIAQVNDNISRTAAKKIVKKYLKSKKKQKTLHVGHVEKVDNFWKIKIDTTQNITVSKVYVDAKTGKITFKR